MVVAVVVGSLCALLLIGAYGAFESHWPSAYVDTRSKAGQLGRFSLPWFLIFRVGPMFVTSAVSAVTSARLHGAPFLASAVLLIMFLVYSAANLWQRSKWSTHRLKEWLVWTVAALLSVVGNVLGLLSWSQIAPLIPRPDELLTAVWTALIVVAVYYGFQRLFVQDQGEARALQRGKKDIGQAAWKHAVSAAKVHSVPPSAVHAILLAESIQRPRWFRRVERLVQYVRGRVHRSGTTGIAQMRSARPLTDEESIDLLCIDMQRWTASQSVGDLNELEVFEEYAIHHNPDDVFVSTAADYYYTLRLPPCESTAT